MKQPLLITSERYFGKALRQTAREVFGIKMSALPCEGVVVHPYGDVWFRGLGGRYAAGGELRRRWDAGEVSHAVVGPLGERDGEEAGLFAAFLNHFYRCPVPVIELEAGGATIPAASAYTPWAWVSVARLADALRWSAPAAPAAEAGRLVKERLWRVLTHDFGKMENKARAASRQRGGVAARVAAARRLLLMYQDLRLLTSFLHGEPGHQHLLPEHALRGLESDCGVVLAGGTPLDRAWVSRLKSYIGECAAAVESWC